MVNEQFEGKPGALIRIVTAGSLKATSTLKIEGVTAKEGPLSHQWWQYILRGVKPEITCAGSIHTIDFFCGAGGLSLGAEKAIEAVGMQYVPLAAIDVDGDALEVYNLNFKPTTIIQTNVASLVDYHVYGRGEASQLAYEPEIIDARLATFMGRIDLVLAGPPCQGHSNLNNHTRGSDPRNMLYVSVAATIVALKAQMAVIENVPEVLNDKTGIVSTAKKILRDAGYTVSDVVLSAAELGGAQTRKRHFLVATKKNHVPIDEVAVQLRQRAMTLREAIGDLESIGGQPSFMYKLAILSLENKVRIDYLFDHDLYDLPDKERPDCHKDGHTYPSVYGRLDWDKPSPTITTGFVTPGRGRYIHPSQRRVITPREAARIQGFPDDFIFAPDGETPSRKLLSKWIGDAVPSWLGYTAVLTALSGY